MLTELQLYCSVVMSVVNLARLFRAEFRVPEWSEQRICCTSENATDSHLQLAALSNRPARYERIKRSTRNLSLQLLFTNFYQKFIIIVFAILEVLTHDPGIHRDLISFAGPVPMRDSPFFSSKCAANTEGPKFVSVMWMSFLKRSVEVLILTWRNRDYS